MSHANHNSLSMDFLSPLFSCYILVGHYGPICFGEHINGGTLGRPIDSTNRVNFREQICIRIEE